MTAPARPYAGWKDLRRFLAPVSAPEPAPAPGADDPFTLLLVHHAGGSAAAFAPLLRHLPADWRVLAVDLPGRMMAGGEDGCRSTGEAVDWLAPLTRRAVRGPYGVFGHSMGALIAYELSRELSRRGRPPVWVGLSGAPAPGHRPDRAQRHLWSRDRLTRFMRELGGTPEEVLALPELVEPMVEALRGDLAVVDTYAEHPGPPLSVPLSLFTGRDDPVAGPELAAPWAGHTRAATKAHAWPGGHFYLFEHAAEVCQALARDVTDARRNLPEHIMSRRLFTSESVTEGHPDKIADRISDTILDALLAQDPASRVAVETLITTGQVHIAGEVSTSAYADIATLVRDTVLEIGYDSSLKGFDGASCGVSVSIGAQSPDIAQGVDTAYESRVEGAGDELAAQGAGDQGIMFGYACDETPELMPLPIHLAHRLSRRLTEVRKNGTVPYLRPDGKTQVTIAYDGDVPVRLDTVVVSSQHASDIDLDSLLAPDIRTHVVEHVLARLAEDGIKLETEGYRLLVNPTGRFEIGGPMGDAGLTGRKIIIDTYGGMARHGGGAFSGKDPSKVDRSAAYAMRWVAKNVVAAGLARRCEVQVAYAIGKAEPVGLFVETFGTHTVGTEKIEQAIAEVFDLRPAAIIRDLDLKRPIYAATAAYGHFGRELPDFTWERTDRAEALKAAAGR
ncbi:hypothetical protein GCM10017752_20210 [Streptomyces roseoviridis]